MIDDRELGPRPPALAALLDAERRAPRAPAVDRARVWAGVLAKLPPPGGPSDPPSGDPQPGGADGASGAAGSAAAAAQTATTATTATTSALQAISLKTALLGVVVAIGLGAALFVSTREASAPVPAPAPVQATPAPAVSPVEPPAHPAPIAPEPAPPTPSTPPALPRTTQATRVKAAASHSETAADVEDAIIERARMSLARAQFEEALGLLYDHEKRFPAGAQRKERELLIVRALLGTSNRAAAEERAKRMRKTDPDSPQLRAIEAALAK